jgi:diguanylate cyclase (GGDEF)-like protein
MADAYVATAALILAASLIETSYVLAYHDELTGIRGRRAFNESLLSLDQQYAIAIVDIDHFKKFNDTYGHDVGDQVLCMVAKRLSDVGGDGQAFRCGGEEFAIVFRNTSAKEAFEHLDALRQRIEKSTFQLRGADRRAEKAAERSAEKSTNRRTGTSQSDRRKSAKRKATASSSTQRELFPQPASQSPDRKSDHLPDRVSDRLSVTVSIGVAEPSTRIRQPEQVIQSADQALYRAKNEGRNRVELASTASLRVAKEKRSKASRF